MAEEVRLWHSATIIDTEEQCLSRRVLMSSCWMGISADLLLISGIYTTDICTNEAVFSETGDVSNEI